VCERADDVVSPSERPSRLEEDLPPHPSERPSRLAEDLPLHLRVLKAIVEGQPMQDRMDQALALANEVYELEANGEFED
jgi:hypothetical protein